MRRIAIAGVALAGLAGLPGAASAHPLGNFTVNQFARISVHTSSVEVRYVVDMAEIPTLQEMAVIDTDGNGGVEPSELDAYAARTASELVPFLEVTAAGSPLPLEISSANAALLPGAGGLETLRLECTGTALLTPETGTALRTGTVRFSFRNAAFGERLGWRELMLDGGTGVQVFNSSIFGSSLSQELRGYPEDSLTSPLDERSGEFSAHSGAPIAGVEGVRMRDGRVLAPVRDRLAELVTAPELTPWAILAGLLIAVALGGLHALSPGHGKTVVGAYLVGARGTVRHALFLGLTVTITHTAGVFALGLVTLFASHLVNPERLFPVLALASGAIVLVMGASMFVARLRSVLGMTTGPDHHHHDHDHDGSGHGHSHGDHVHSHGGAAHSHMPPGADGSPITLSSLLALGVSGGLLPCPSALVVMLAAIALHRVGYGLLLVVAFSVGLAGVLTGIGIAFLHAGKLLKRTSRFEWASRVIPVLSAGVIAIVGALMCYSAAVQAGFDIGALARQLCAEAENPSFGSASALGILGLGLLFGLKHATEADHVVAVSTIVSEHKQVRKAALVGALWGAGHTASLVVVGAVVLAFRIAIPETVAGWLEFAVGLMIITLGALALFRGLSGRSRVHVHKHSHGGAGHVHVHFHDGDGAGEHDGSLHDHPVARIGLKPLVVGAVHGLAGSAALTLLILAQIPSAFLGVLYLTVFGLGSIAGMFVMSGLVGLPFALTSRGLTRTHSGLQVLAGLASVLFGIWYAYESSGALAAAVLMWR